MTRGEEKLDICGCCEGIDPRTPRYNRPGLSEIASRLDTHPEFLRRMLANIYLQRVPDDSRDPPLCRLTTRSKDDPAIAIQGGTPRTVPGTLCNGEWQGGGDVPHIRLVQGR